jgi:glycerol-3-phosphate dehydrogenase
VARPQPGLVSIAGGKYTTYRVMAADAVDAARQDIGGEVSDSVTEFIPLSGAEGYVALVNQIDRLARHQDLPVWRIRHLLDRYGSLVHELFALAEGDRSLYEPMPGAEEYLKVEIRYAADHEAALHLDDILARRTRISIETPSRGVDSARAAADIVAPVLGWDDERVDAEVAAYLARVEAELDSQRELADSEANEERLSAPDARRIPLSRAPEVP